MKRKRARAKIKETVEHRYSRAEFRNKYRMVTHSLQPTQLRNHEQNF